MGMAPPRDARVARATSAAPAVSAGVRAEWLGQKEDGALAGFSRWDGSQGNSSFELFHVAVAFCHGARRAQACAMSQDVALRVAFCVTWRGAMTARVSSTLGI